MRKKPFGLVLLCLVALQLIGLSSADDYPICCVQEAIQYQCSSGYSCCDCKQCCSSTEFCSNSYCVSYFIVTLGPLALAFFVASLLVNKVLQEKEKRYRDDVKKLEEQNFTQGPMNNVISGSMSNLEEQIPQNIQDSIESEESKEDRNENNDQQETIMESAQQDTTKGFQSNFNERTRKINEDNNSFTIQEFGLGRENKSIQELNQPLLMGNDDDDEATQQYEFKQERSDSKTINPNATIRQFVPN